MLYAFFMLDNISGWELFIILAVIYLFFGAKAIPKFFQSFKQRWAELQRAMREVRKELKG